MRLSTLIGWERAAQQKSAGLRTHTLVGFIGGGLIFVRRDAVQGADDRRHHLAHLRGYSLLFAHLAPGADPATFEVRLPGRADPAAQVPLRLEGSADVGQLASDLFRNGGVTEVEPTASADDERVAEAGGGGATRDQPRH